jgi:hypothetical protein
MHRRVLWRLIVYRLDSRIQNFLTSPFANTRVVPFVDSYFEILKSIVDDINTEYFWFFLRLH